MEISFSAWAEVGFYQRPNIRHTLVQAPQMAASELVHLQACKHLKKKKLTRECEAVIAEVSQVGESVMCFKLTTKL